MKCVISPGVSAGSKYVGASEMCTPQLSEPSGLAAAGPAGASASIETAATSTAIRMRRMRSILTLGLFPAALERRVQGKGWQDPARAWPAPLDPRAGAR
jgi:hypothetical protein